MDAVREERATVKRSDAAAVVVAALFVLAFFWLTSRQYQRFDLVAPDVATFGQAIWYTLRGRFLFSTIVERSILGYHFSPGMAGLAPLLLIWNDIRVLFLAQTVAVAASGLILYWLVRRAHPSLALWFLLAFFLNPSLHEVALHELRRVILAMPFLALGVFGLEARRYRLMAGALMVALLFKEDIGLIVFAFGIYLVLLRREYRWGGSLALVGAVWAVGVTFLVIPAFGRGDEYAQIGYYARWGNSPLELATVFLREPGAVLAWIFEPQALKSLLRVLLPLGLLLPFLAADIVLLAVPSLLLALLSSYEQMHRLEDWYMAPLLPLLAGAVAVAMSRLPRRDAGRVAWSLLGSAAAGFMLFSPAPPGGRFAAAAYQLDAHHQLAAGIVAAVPAEAAVVAQDAYLAHLTERRQLRQFPWVSEQDPVDYYVLDRKLDAYPLTNQEVNWEIDNLVADPGLTVRMEGDGAFLLQRNGQPLPAHAVGAVAEETILLERLEVAVGSAGDFYEPQGDVPAAIYPGQTLRVYLYWRALGRPPGERTVSVRLTNAGGEMIVQHDMQPSSGARPTSWWQPGWHFRDVYYLPLPADSAPGAATLAVTLYDSYTGEPVPFDSGEVVLPLLPVQIKEGAPAARANGQ